MEIASTNPPSRQMLLRDSMGQLTIIPTNRISRHLLPPVRIGMTNQVPEPTRGMVVPAPIREREEAQQARRDTLRFFPSYTMPLAPYLEGQDDFGNTALKPGALIPWTPIDAAAQQMKYWSSEAGLRYSLKQTITYVNMTDVMQGDNTLGYYTLSFQGKWSIYDDPPSGTSGWLSTQVKVKTGIGDNGMTQSAQRNLGTITDPTGLWLSFNGIAVQELAWQQSFRDGEIVFLGGVLNQANYLDVNSYANSGRGQFINSALINSMVMPLPGYLPGVNLQWQFDDEWYAMVGASAGTAKAGYPPWSGFSFNSWSAAWELGYMPKNFLGLGPGVYRIQPFVSQVTGVEQASYTVTIPGTTVTTNVTISTTTNSPLQPGLCFNFQQQLGERVPVGWYGRFGFGGWQTTAGASAQIGTGFVTRGPLAYLGLFPSRKYDAAGVGFAWSQPSDGSSTVYHENEFALEAGYVLQLTPLAKLQPDFQVVWNPAYNPGANRAFVFQLQLDVAW